MHPDSIPDEVVKHGKGLPCVDYKLRLKEHPLKTIKNDTNTNNFNTILDEADLKKKIIHFEGHATHMYLDTAKKPNVTAGIGFNIQNENEAIKLPFKWREDETEEDRKNGYGTGKKGAPLRKAGEISTKKDILAEHGHIQKQTKNMSSKNYKKFTKLGLDDEDIEKKFDAEYESVKKQLRSGLKTKKADFDSFPGPAKAALINMAFNLGTTGVLSWTNLPEKIKARDWVGASEECIYNSSLPSFNERNAYNINKFLEAAKIEPRD